MNIALIGYGKMGKEVERVAKERGHTVSLILDIENNQNGQGLSEDSLRDVDVCIDFSTPSAVLTNIERVIACKKPMVVGTTGWYEHLDEITEMVKSSGIGFIYASNFSIGMNLFFKIVEFAGKLFNGFADYDVCVHEIHHNQKADSPGGTALMLGKVLLDNIERKKELLTETSKGQISSSALHVTSTRVGSVPGTHIVGFDSLADTIELRHTTRSRIGYAVGAIRAAEWIIDRKGVNTMADLLESEIGYVDRATNSPSSITVERNFI